MVLKVLAYEATFSYLKVNLKQTVVMSFPHIAEKSLAVCSSIYCFDIKIDKDMRYLLMKLGNLVNFQAPHTSTVWTMSEWRQKLDL